MTEVYLDDDADLGLVQDRNVAVLGYDDQARAQALCLRDSGVDVRVGLVTGSALWEEAVADGLRVVTPYEACEEADLLVLTALDSADEVVSEVVLPNLVAGDVVVLGVQARMDVAPEGVDVVRVMPWATGSVVREEYEVGRGVPMFAAVVREASSAAWDLVLAYARAIGGTRAGVIRASDEEYASALVYADATLLRGEVLALVRRGFDRLVGSGCQPEVAYLHCIEGLRGFAGDLLRGDLDAELAAARDTAGGPPAADPLPVAAARVRSMMGWRRADRAGLD